MKPFFLIGYMGSGKTTLGNQLAKKLNLPFIDMDLFIENRYHKSIPAIFEEKGEDGFREIERRTLQEISSFENVIISTGGGLPCFFDNMDLMNKSGITIYLKVSVEELTNRLKNAKIKRPLISNKTFDELKEYVKSSLTQREAFYNNATHTFDCENLFEYENFNDKIEQLIKKSQ
jgi:shikimate kinase